MAQEDSIPIPLVETNSNTDLPPPKKKRNLPGNPDPEAEVIALSPKTLMATNRFLCEICGKGFQRDQNLQLHRRGHNLPWKLKQRSGKEPKKRVYVCPEKTCVHNHPSRALGDLTGIKKHFCRKHGEKKWKCDKCSKSYAVHSDCKAHSKTCGTREYKCDCGTIFSRRDSFITHRAFCEALAEETARVNAASHFSLAASNGSLDYGLMGGFMASQQQQQQQQQQQNFTLFKSLPTKEDNEATMINIDHHHHHQKGSIPLWIMGQALPQQDQTTVRNDVIHQQLNNNSFYPCPQTLVSGLNPLQEQQLIQAPESNYQNLNWAFGNPAAKMCSNSTSTTSLIPQTISTTNRDQELVGNVPCLYSNQLQTSSSSSHMSATAILQKAAQIGSSTTDPFFIGGTNTNESKNSTNSIINEVQDHRLHHQVSKFCDVESTRNELSSMNNNAQMEMYSGASKRRRIVQSNEQINNQYHHYNQTGDGGQTRDFLGVGAVESICHPNSINEWI